MPVNLAESTTLNLMRGLKQFSDDIDSMQKMRLQNEALKKQKEQEEFLKSFGDAQAAGNKRKEYLAKTRGFKDIYSVDDKTQRLFDKMDMDFSQNWASKGMQYGVDPNKMMQAAGPQLPDREKLNIQAQQTLKIAQVKADAKAKAAENQPSIEEKATVQEEARAKVKNKYNIKSLPKYLRPSVDKEAFYTEDTVKDIKKFENFANNYEKNLKSLYLLIKEHGTEVRGKIAGDMKSLVSELTGGEKGQFSLDLGVLTGPDLDIVRGKIPDPTAFTSYGIPNSEMLSSLKESLKVFKRKRADFYRANNLDVPKYGKNLDGAIE